MLPAKTKDVFAQLSRVPEIGKFILVGGTALTLRIRHRLSEDLDFAYRDDKLPRRLIDKIVNRLRQTAKMERFEHVAARQDFENAGLDIDDHQQDFMVDGQVKLSFFTLDQTGVAARLKATPLPKVTTNSINPGNIHVASLDSLFLMKGAVLANRILTRDLYDVYVLLTQHGYTGLQFWEGLEAAGLPIDTIAQRLRHAKLRSDDPGLQGLLPNPPDFTRLQAFMVTMLDGVEVELAERAGRSKQ